MFAHLFSMQNMRAMCLLTPRRYLYTAVRNRALKHLEHERMARRAHAMIQNGGYPPAMSPPPSAVHEEVETAELAGAFDRAVDDLPARCREAYVHSRSGMTYAEIAAVMGISVRTVETQVARARQHLRRGLEPWL